MSVCIYNIEHYEMTCRGSFQTVSRGQVLVFINGHCTTMYLVKEKQGRLIPTSLKGLKHFADTT